MKVNEDHDPSEVPLGCNGKPGESGAQIHRRNGEEVCDKCRYAKNHTRRERTRGVRRPKKLQPCGTPGAAQRHRDHGEKVCFPCRVAEADYNGIVADGTARNRLYEIKRLIEVETPPEKFMMLVSEIVGAK